MECAWLWISKGTRRWMKASDFEIDCELVPFDTKRVVLEDVETVISEKTGR